MREVVGAERVGHEFDAPGALGGLVALIDQALLVLHLVAELVREDALRRRVAEADGGHRLHQAVAHHDLGRPAIRLRHLVGRARRGDRVEGEHRVRATAQLRLLPDQVDHVLGDRPRLRLGDAVHGGENPGGARQVAEHVRSVHRDELDVAGRDVPELPQVPELVGQRVRVLAVGAERLRCRVRPEDNRVDDRHREAARLADRVHDVRVESGEDRVQVSVEVGVLRARRTGRGGEHGPPRLLDAQAFEVGSQPLPPVGGQCRLEGLDVGARRRGHRRSTRLRGGHRRGRADRTREDRREPRCQCGSLLHRNS
ncbi:hypothetical protein [Actinokineospora sp. HUAS TT18]|uniref:hypothetical protein n=1 Tax=Actinokineospora sp. HUAS TT18 TaxID=3447451 RepID=UPI003F523289